MSHNPTKIQKPKNGEGFASLKTFVEKQEIEKESTVLSKETNYIPKG